jgi:hypothetical protein
MVLARASHKANELDVLSDRMKSVVDVQGLFADMAEDRSIHGIPKVIFSVWYLVVRFHILSPAVDKERVINLEGRSNCAAL